MKIILTLIITSLIGLSVSCKSHERCPAYSKAHSNKHQSYTRA